MKFGKQIKRLADPTALHHCIAYDVLKKAITVVVESETNAGTDIEGLQEVQQAFVESAAFTGPSRPPDSRFHTLLQHELAKVNRYTNLQFRLLLDTLQEAQRIAGKDGLSEEALSELERLLDTAAEKLISLEHFRRLNFTGFRKIAKKFDKRSAEAKLKGGSVTSWFLPSLMREPFVAEPLDPYMMGLALGYAELRRRRRGGPGSAASPGKAASPTPTPHSPARASATTHTFWLMPPARLQALCTLIKRFELVLPGHSAETGLLPVERMRNLLTLMAPDSPARATTRLGAATSMVYYDTDDFGQYMERVNAGGPHGIRYRSTAQGVSGSGIIEFDGSQSALGAHAFTPVLQGCGPDAFELYPEGQDRSEEPGEALLRAAEAAQEAPGLARYVKDLVAASRAPGKQLSVKAAVGSSRVLLRGDTQATEGIAIALDEDVQFTLQPTESAATAPSDAIDFPYCLLEVGGDREAGGASEWLEELFSCASLRTVQGFSVGTQAVVSLHQDVVPARPHWFEHLHAMESQAPPEAWGLTLEWRAALNEEGMEGTAATEGAESTTNVASQVAAAPLPTPPGPVTPAVPKILEPKNFLASERTMLEWVHTVLALAVLGIGLWKYSLNITDSAGGVSYIAFGLLNNATTGSTMVGCYSLSLVLIAVCFVWYAVLTHTARLNALYQNKITEGTFNGRVAPTLFVSAIGTALAAQLAVQATVLWQGQGQ